MSEMPNPHVFRLWEELGTGLMEVECEAPNCDWKATFNPPISAAMKAQALRFQKEHQQASELEAAQARLDKGRALHQRCDDGEDGFRPDGGYGTVAPCCETCGSYGEYTEPWPCATARALGLGEEGDDA